MGVTIFIFTLGLTFLAIGMAVALLATVLKLAWVLLQFAGGLLLLPLKFISVLFVLVVFATLVVATAGLPVFVMGLLVLLPVFFLIGLPVCLLWALCRN